MTQLYCYWTPILVHSRLIQLYLIMTDVILDPN